MHRLVAALIAAVSISFAAHTVAWDGYDLETGAQVTIESGNLVQVGEEIEYYDWDAGEYRYAEVGYINRIGSTVEIEVYDYETGRYRLLEMYD